MPVSRWAGAALARVTQAEDDQRIFTRLLEVNVVGYVQSIEARRRGPATALTAASY